jgi:hypothetical protein
MESVDEPCTEMASEMDKATKPSTVNRSFTELPTVVDKATKSNTSGEALRNGLHNN